MIAGIFHSGSGLGDQLFRYITTRTLTMDKEYEFGMVYPENFKGKDFLNIDMGKEAKFGVPLWEEKKVLENGIDIRSYDPEINFVEDNTIIDGNFEDEKYWGHRLPEIGQWLVPKGKVLFDDSNGDICVINFRGGEYATIPELFLPQSYWDKAIYLKKEQGIKNFEVHTDDINLAKLFFPDFPIYQNIQLNWEAVRYASHLILSNSAFGILPAMINLNVKEVIAPRYHARRNIKVWARPSCYYRKFTYI